MPKKNSGENISSLIKLTPQTNSQSKKRQAQRNRWAFEVLQLNVKCKQTM